jgi:hypothetical protein
MRASHSYGVVLGLIVGVFVVAEIAPNGPGVSSILLLALAVTFEAALWTSGLERATRGTIVGVAAVSATAAFAQVAAPGSRSAAIGAILSCLFTAATVVVIARGVMLQDTINAKSVTGAVCIYVLLGFFFLFVYAAAAAFGDGHFFAQGTDGTRAQVLYFSFVTLATVGYGDLTPAGNFGRMAVVVEALSGQLYLVTVLALLVSRVAPRQGAG